MVEIEEEERRLKEQASKLQVCVREREKKRDGVGGIYCV